MSTISLELVPKAKTDGRELTLRESQVAREKLERSGILDSVNTIMIPQVIPEDEFRPVELEEKLDPIDTKRYLSTSLPLDYIVTQVTVFSPMEKLKHRAQIIREEDIDRVVFVGGPRGAGDKLVGPTPAETINALKDQIPDCGVILIPTRRSEVSRFAEKVDAGATFGSTQLLYSDYIGTFLGELSHQTDKRPEIILSFGYVPKAEARVGLLEWMIWHDQPIMKQEIDFVADIAEKPFEEKKANMVDLYKRVIDSVHKYDFPIGLQFSIPYGISTPAFETFAEMLDVWSPVREPVGAATRGDD